MVYLSQWSEQNNYFFHISFPLNVIVPISTYLQSNLSLNFINNPNSIIYLSQHV
jgi:hypothetical protein